MDLHSILKKFERSIDLDVNKKHKNGRRRRKRKRRRKGNNQSIRNVLQCKSATKVKKRCKKRTAHTDKCWIHLAKEDNLRVKPSLINNGGKGLFAWKKPFKKNAKISTYTGRRLSKSDVDRKYGEDIAEYVICHRNNCVDANYTTDNAARFANDSRGSAFKDNAFLKGHKNFRLEAKKKIKPNQEILTSYGKGYWTK